MNFVIFTPALAASAIGRATRLVVEALVSQGHQVVVVRAEEAGLFERPAHDFGVPLIAWNDRKMVEAAVQQADVLVYQIGNNYRFHHGCMEWMPAYPGIVCLHDFFLGHLFHEWAQNRQPEAKAVLSEWYGDEVAERYFSIQENFIENTQDIAPMTEWICSMAQAVVTHSSWAIQRVLSACPGPVHVVALAYDMPQIDTTTNAGSRQAGLLSLLTVGHINPNKRPDKVIQAIGNSPYLRDKVTYRLVGLIEPKVATELYALAAQLQVKLAICGEVDDPTLKHEIESADVMCCLRWPALEAASASAIESMLYGKATVVMDTGFYRELPDEYVRKISIENELDDLQAVLEEFCRDGDKAMTLGHNAARWASAHFNGPKYADGLIAIAESTARAEPILTMSRFYSDLVYAWGSIKQDAALDHIILPISQFD